MSHSEKEGYNHERGVEDEHRVDLSFTKGQIEVLMLAVLDALDQSKQRLDGQNPAEMTELSAVREYNSSVEHENELKAVLELLKKALG